MRARLVRMWSRRGRRWGVIRIHRQLLINHQLGMFGATISAFALFLSCQQQATGDNYYCLMEKAINVGIVDHITGSLSVGWTEVQSVIIS